MDKNFLIDFIMPPKCMFCHDVLARGEVCHDCRTKAEFYKIPKENRQINHACFKYLDKCIAFYRYEDMIRDSLLYAKFTNSDAFIREFIGYMDFDLVEFMEENHIDELVSMPYHRSKLFDREYDLPEEMASVIAKSSKLRYNKSCITKVKNTAKQHDLSLTERKNNLRNAFRTDSDVKGKNILVLDDIISTGYSLEEVARTLKKSGAKTVIGIAFAYNKG